MLKNNIMGTDVMGGLDAVDQLKPATREPIAQITENSIGRTTARGRDEYGNDLEQVVPCLASVMMLDLAGNELAISLVNGRVPLQKIITQYGVPKVAEMISEGWLPKNECPLTRRYSNVVATNEGTLIANKDGAEMCTVIGPHGCDHYLAVRDKRREVNAKRAEKRRERAINPTSAMMKIAESFQSYAKSQGSGGAMVEAVKERTETKRNPRGDE